MHQNQIEREPICHASITADELLGHLDDPLCPTQTLFFKIGGRRLSTCVFNMRDVPHARLEAAAIDLQRRSLGGDYNFNPLRYSLKSPFNAGCLRPNEITVFKYSNTLPVS